MSQELTVYSPIDHSVVGTTASLSKDDVDRCILEAKNAQKEWVKIPVYQKAELLYKAADLLEERVEALAEVLMYEIAKDRKSSISEIKRTADFIRYTADLGKSMEGIAVGGENFPGGSREKLSYVRRVPLGIVLAISPFNYPVNLSASKIAPALMGGNAVILKPASQGAISASALVDILHEAGIPKDVVKVVTGRGSEIGDYIVTHPDINFVNFTGSTEVGKHISQIVHMTPLMLELGGKDAAIVLPDADLEFVADNIVEGAFSYSGQRCTAVKRVLTDNHTADLLVPMLKERIERLKVGQPQENAVIVPLINQQSFDFAQGLIDDGVEKGAIVLCGNQSEGTLLYPTLLDQVTEDMRVAWEEPFAPVLPIIRIKNIEDAIRVANLSEYGLQSSVFTNNINDAYYIANQLDVGTVQINNKTERGPDHFPFLGVKASGMGTQGVKYSIEAMTRPKAITIQLLNQESR